MIAVIDYGVGNLKSVENALKKQGADVIITDQADAILAADGVLLPGVGHFAHGMHCLKKSKLDQVIWQVVDQGTPLLGICLGLQLLFEKSAEAPDVSGMGILKGEILKIPDKTDLKVPHVGWNSLNFLGKSKLFQGFSQNPYVYFVHSYYLQAKDTSLVTATTEYGVTIQAAVADERRKVYACQFHPEKSGLVGLQMLKNFILIAESD
ncbi:MAG: imidazole glycerol phosphate synthase subunit HisH [Lachnospiraceae bacterium]|nr:imidazole glycerol phosphate synthase subunit HisH [Lachnospiraceae bacterium]